MFLTRMGFRSKIVVTGDPSQIDLPRGKKSGLIEAVEVLDGVEDIAIQRLTHQDVVRHELVQAIVRAYDARALRAKEEYHYGRNAEESGFLSAGAFSGKDIMEITVHGNEDRILLISRFDNLGKGASGAAIQNMNLALGVEETYGLITQ